MAEGDRRGVTPRNDGENYEFRAVGVTAPFQPPTQPRLSPTASPVQGGGSTSVAERNRRGVTPRNDSENDEFRAVSVTVPPGDVQAPAPEPRT